MSVFMEQLKSRHLNRMRTVNLDFVRGMMNTINWNDRLIMIKGQRGVGKTTLMLQRILEQFGPTDTSTVLYISLDNIYFATHRLLDFIEQFHKMGGKNLFIDEVHKYEGWSREVKNAYDEFTDLKLVLSGSSLINMMEGEADLSRRCISYEMQGLSFREYIAMFHHHKFDPITLDDVLTHGNDLCHEVNVIMRPLALFQQYLKQGYYPFLIEGAESYYTRIENVVNMTIESELPQMRRLDVGNIRKIQALLVTLSSGLPYILDTTKLSSLSGIARTTLLQYLQYLHESRLINLLYSDMSTVKRMQKPDKIYIENTNLLHTLSVSVNTGTEREVFFVNQLSMSHQIEYSKTAADFTIDHTFTIEVGGPSKGNKQLAGVTNGYIAADDEEYTIGNKIPLWLFGFLY